VVGPTSPSAADDDPIAALLADVPVGRRSRRPWYLGAAAVVTAVVVAVAVVLVGRADPPTYSEASRAEFMAACTADGGPPVEPVCACIYDELVARVPYDRFALLDEQLRAVTPDLPQGFPVELPDDVQAIVDGCVVRVGPTA
jgi:hypothetical protein